jgi:hypothetical protein
LLVLFCQKHSNETAQKMSNDKVMTLRAKKLETL